MALTAPQTIGLNAIKTAASKYNVDWRVMAALAHHESNLNPGSVGDGGHAIGLFQLNNAGGVLTGKSPQEYQSYADPNKNADYAASALAKLGIVKGSGTPEAQIAQGVNRFERPANKGAEISDATAWYRSTLAGASPNISPAQTSRAPAAVSTGQVRQNVATPVDESRNQLLAYVMNQNQQFAAQGPQQVQDQAPSLLQTLLANSQASAPQSVQQAPSSVAPAGKTPKGNVPTQTQPGSPPGAGKGGYTMPIAGKWTKLGVPYQGTHTRFGNWESDNAIDMGVPIGTPIYAPSGGVIGDRIGSMGADGLRVNLKGADNAFYLAHLSKIAVKPGQKVKAGDLIGYSGASANGAAHLHIGVEKGDPRTYFNYGG